MWIILIPLLIFSLTARFNEKRSRIAWVGFVLFAVVYMLRGSVATDWQAYLYYYNNINDNAIVAVSGFESGYILLCKIFYNLGLSYWTMNAFISFAILVLFYLAIRDLTNNIGIALLLSIFYFFYPSLESLRQTVTLALFLYSLLFIDTEPKKYFLLNFLGILFHRTGFITLLFFFFRKYRIVKIASVCCLMAFSALQPLIIQVLGYFPGLLQKYLWYFEYLGGESGFRYLLSFKVIEYLLLTICFLLIKNKNRREQIATNLLELGVIIEVFLPMIMSASYRFAYYSDFGVMLGYSYLPNRLKKKHHKAVYVLFVIAYVTFRFYRIISMNQHIFG